MLGLAWTEIALIGVVALVLIGPKDLPVAIKAVAGMVKKARKMAAEFQGHVDEMVKDTSIAEVRQQINEIRNFDIRGEIERAVDADGSIRSTFADDPFRNRPPPTTSQPVAEAVAVANMPKVAAPAFVPPEFVPHEIVPPEAAVPAAPVVPAFIPPGVAPPGSHCA